MSKTKPGTYVLAFDLHYPKIHKPTFDAMIDFIKGNPIAGFIFGGDQLDNAEISHFNVRRIIFREPGLYKKNTDGFDRDILKPIEAALPKTAKRVWIEGNHDGSNAGGWEGQLVEENPELKGTVERRILLDLEKRGWEVYVTGTGYDLGKLLVIHGESLSGSSHAKKATDNYAQSVVYGHFHSIQSHTKVLPHNKSDKWIGQCLPAMCETNPVYLRNAPTSWVNGFGIVEVDEEGNFNVYPVVVTKGKFRYGGKTYQGTKTKTRKRVSVKRSK